MRSHRLLIIRLILALVLIGFVAGFVVSQYDYVRILVTVLCPSCIGIG
jgi:hypothetical protein